MEWQDYYDHLSRSSADIRPGCEPQILLHDGTMDRNGVVLVHGLTDSPHFMRAIGQRFFDWGFNVYIPLLVGHGLKDPQGMVGVQSQQWIENVDFALAQALTSSAQVSIGGLSTGGTLSLHAALYGQYAIQSVFLFSAALGLAGPLGNVAEEALRSLFVQPLAKIQDLKERPLVSDRADLNPYRYHRMDTDGAKELAEILQILDRWFRKEMQSRPLQSSVFAAHSEDDTVADIQRIDELVEYLGPAKSDFFRIGQGFRVPHASVVLAEPVKSANGSFLEPKNPFFNEMMNLAQAFCRRHLS